MTLDDLVFAIESGAEAVPMIQRYKANMEGETAEIIVELLDGAYGSQKATYERLARCSGVWPSVSAEMERREEIKNAKHRAWRSEQAAKEAAEKVKTATEAAMGNDPDFVPTAAEKLPVQNDEF